MSPAKPDLCVVMSVRNGGAYLPPAIDSILTQTFRDFQFLIMDDKSTDETAEVLARYAAQDPRITLLQGEGRGLAAALNLALEKTNADLIARMDADDISLPERFAIQRDWMTAHPECVALGTAVQTIDADDNPLRIRKYPSNPADIRDRLLMRNCVCHPSAMIRRSALRQISGYRENFLTSQDYDLWLRLLSVGDIANLPDVLLQYRKHNTRTSDSANRSRQTLYSVAAIASHLGQQVNAPQVDMNDITEETVLSQLCALQPLMAQTEYAHAFSRHVMRFISTAQGLSGTQIRSLLSALSTKDRLKVKLYAWFR